MSTKQQIDPTVMEELWKRAGAAIEGPIRMFVNVGIKPLKGEKKKDAELKIWTEVAKTAFLAGLEAGYDMGQAVFAPPQAESETKE